MTGDPFDQCLKTVEEVAGPLGYTRRGARFVQRFAESDGEVWYQKSRTSIEGVVRFTVNLSITLLPLLPPISLGSVRRRHAEDHWTERLGFLLPENDDVWWEVDPCSVVEIGSFHADLFARVVHPTLVERQSVAWHVDRWRRRDVRWKSEVQWQTYLAKAERLGY